jgi:dTDP-4-dehydrorhamnose 3,5-epimerase
MKILSVIPLAIPDIKVIRFARFADQRGYFTEPFRRSDFDGHAETAFLKNVPFRQMNESYSRAGTLRGLHFQWNPYMGKLVRTLHGRMLDVVLDIRKGSPTLGRAFMHDMPSRPDGDVGEWIWVPPGFAHGNLFPEDSRIEYYCTSEYSAGCEAGISPLAPDIDWSLADPSLKRLFDERIAQGSILSDKDRQGPSLQGWLADRRSDEFVYGHC